MVFKNPCCCLRRSKIGYRDSSEEEIHSLTEVQASPPVKSLLIPLNEIQLYVDPRMEDQQLHADSQQYQILGLICRCYDGSASIHVAKHKPTGRYLSIKKVDLDMIDRQKCGLSSLHHEFNLMRQMQHEHILPYYSAFVCKHELWVVLPLMEQGSARDLLDKHCPDGLGETAIAHIIRDVLLALSYIHKMRFVHRSVKASHIFLSRTGKVYLSGFRSAVSMVENGKKLRAIHDFPADMVQNLHWLAPEVLEQNLLGYDEKSDIYSVGITACELANGCIPFSDMPAMKMLLEKINCTTPKLLDRSTLRESENIEVDRAPDSQPEQEPIALSSEPNPYARQFSPQFHDFIEVCLRHDPNDRPGAVQLLNHPFFKQVKKPSTEVLSVLFQNIKPVSYTPSHPGSEDVTNSLQRLQQMGITEPWSFD